MNLLSEIEKLSSRKIIDLLSSSELSDEDNNILIQELKERHPESFYPIHNIKYHAIKEFATEYEAIWTK